MKVVRFTIPFLLTVALVVLMNLKFGQLPPLGKFFDPLHGFWQNAETKELVFEDHPALEGLQNNVKVATDNRLVPHVFAENEHDLFFMQGYLHAQYRLWQMEFQVMAAAGRISEIVGQRALPLDRKMRRLGLKLGAKNAVEAFKNDTETKEVMSAYRDGVNAYISQLSYNELPVEYKLLNYRPEKWSHLKTVLLLKYMANTLAGREFDLPYTNALKKFGSETFNLLYPEFPDTIDPIIPKSKNFTFQPVEIDSAKIPEPKEYHEGLPFQNSKRNEPIEGSNNWAVSGAKTESGQPILCNDPHLGLNMPSIWFEMQLSAPGYESYGATIPGSPCVIIGFNRQVAWGETNASWDVKDWYRIEFKSKNRDYYRYDGDWKKTDKVVEEIKIRGGESFYDTIVHTHHGPVTYDKHFPGEGGHKNLALQWTAHDPSNELTTFYHLNQAEDYEDYRKALTFYQCPAQNFAFASQEGDIAIWQNGKFPLQWDQQGRFIMDGSSSDYEWQGFVPHQHKPHIVNPKRGFVSSANQHPTDTTYPYYYNGIYQYWRNRRINNRLRDMDNITPHDMKQLQNDNMNLLASETLPLMLELLQAESLSGNADKAYDLLNNWNYENNRELRAPTVYTVWWDTLTTLIWDEMHDKNRPMVEPNEYTTTTFLKEHQGHPLMDIQATQEKENASDVVTKAFHGAIGRLDTVENWRWAPFKGTRLAHLARIDAFNVKDLPIGGDRNIVNAASKTHGPSWRMVVELTDPIEAYGIYPGGQSGNPGSPYYDDFAQDWANGEYYKLLFMEEPDDYSDKMMKQQTYSP